MAKRTASFTTSDLIEQLMPLRNDPGKLHEALAGFDTALVRDALARLLAAPAVKGTAEKHRMMISNRPRMPNETFEDVAAYLDRDTLDSMQLACHFMLDFIRERETDKFALRFSLNQRYGHSEGWYWLPVSFVSRDRNNRRRLTSMHRVSTFLRLSYCEKVTIDLAQFQRNEGDGMDGAEIELESLYGVLFDDLDVGNTSVDVLTIEMAEGCAVTVKRCIDAFKSTKRVRLELDDYWTKKPFDEDFFVGLADSGVRSFGFYDMNKTDVVSMDIDLQATLAFGFAEPNAGGDRCLAGVWVRAGDELLAEVRMRASQLDGHQKVDFKFKIQACNLFEWDDPIGFEKYRKRKAKWVFDDLPNKIIVEVKQTKDFVKISAHSSA